MIVEYNFIPQRGKIPKNKGRGILIMENGEAIFLGVGSIILGKLIKPEIISITTRGIFLKGLEARGHDSQGKGRYRDMEWYCQFYDGSTKKERYDTEDKSE